MRSKLLPKRLLLTALAVVGLCLLTIIVGGIVVFQRYVQTEYVDAETAARAFTEVQSRFTGQVPLAAYQGFDGVVRRNPSAPRRELRTLHALAYTASDGELQRADIPWRLVRLSTLGGRRPLMKMVVLGDRSTELTVEDIERHGPGLVLDASGGSVGPLVAFDVLAGTDARKSRLIMWTE